MSRGSFHHLHRAHVRAVTAQAGRMRAAIRHTAARWLPGEFRSPHRTTRGLEMLNIRAFQPGDDWTALDKRRLAPLATKPIHHAVFNGELRLVEALRHAEGHAVFILDLSASLLDAWWLEFPGTGSACARSKYFALLQAASLLMTFIEDAGFAITALPVHRGQRTPAIFERAPRAFASRMLMEIGRRLAATARDLGTVNYTEPLTTLQTGCGEALRVLRQRSVVFVLSDFLEPHATWAPQLRRLMAMHQVVAVDLSSPLDRKLSIPNWYEVERAQEERDYALAAPLEEGSSRRAVPIAKIIQWRQWVQEQREVLARLARHGMLRLDFHAGTAAVLLSRCVRVFGLIT